MFLATSLENLGKFKFVFEIFEFFLEFLETFEKTQIFFEIFGICLENFDLFCNFWKFLKIENLLKFLDFFWNILNCFGKF